MKQYGNIMKRGIIISILIVLLSFALAGTVAAADPQAPGLSGYGNGTPHMAYYPNMTANSSMGGHGYMMMRNYGPGMGMRGAYPGIQGGAGAVHGTGVHVGSMFFGIILALLILVWLIVGILVIVLLVRKLRKPKTP
jgi:hypothetical protein